MQTQSSNENSVCPSVRPSVCHTCDLSQSRRNATPKVYTIRQII